MITITWSEEKGKFIRLDEDDPNFNILEHLNEAMKHE